MTKAELATDNDELVETIEEVYELLDDDQVKKAKKVLSNKLDQYGYFENDEDENGEDDQED